MSDLDDTLATWVAMIDSAAMAANKHTAMLADRLDSTPVEDRGPEYTLSRALQCIAVQMAYAGTIAAADFYMAYIAEETAEAEEEEEEDDGPPA